MSSKPQAYDFKWVQIFRNGDAHSPPVRFFVSRKYHKTFECLLNSLTLRLNPTFGAIRRLYTLQGRKINHLEELQANQKYVAAGYEKFRRASYENLKGLSWRRRQRPLSFFEIQPVIHSRIKVASRYKLALENSVALTIFVYRNGDDITPAHVVPLSKKDMLTWDLILKRISERVLPTGFVRKLYNLDGQPLNHYTELQNGESYVAVAGYEGFKNVTYGIFAPKVTRKFSPWRHDNGTSQGSTVHESKDFALHRSGSSLSATSSHESGRTRLHLLNEREKQKGIFTVKEERNAQPGRIRQIDYDEDNSGIYRAKTHSREAVNEINDSEETSIELPFDARCAEEIKDEEIAEKPHKIRKELNSNSTVSHLDTMSASEPSLEVDFEESSHTDNTFVRETKTVKKSVSEEREHSAGRERKQGGSRLKRGTTTRDSTILDDDQRTIRWPFNKLDLHSALFETGKNMIPDPRFLSNAEQKTTESSKESSKFIQYKGDFIENSEISIDTSKKTKSITASGQGFSKLPVANAKLNKNEYPLNEGQSTISSLSEKTITEKPSHLVHYSNRAKNTSLKKKTPREIETSTVTYSPKSTTTVGDDDESNFLTSRFSMMSMSGPTMAETDISDISSRDDFTLLPDFSEYASRDFQNRNATKDSSPNTGEFSRPGIPYNKLNNCASYLDDRSLDFTLPHITEEYEAMKASTSALSLTLNSEGGSQTVNSETTYLSNRSHSSRSENTNSADYLSTDDSHYNLEEKENLSSSKYNNFKFNNKIRSNVFSIPHLL